MVVGLAGHRIALDMHEDGADINFVSHAHSDHISGLRKNKAAIASAATKELLAARSKRMELIPVPKGAELLNAGHMLGSRQLYIDSDDNGNSVLYSGDYQMQKCYAAESIETRRADILIIDSTYPHPGVVFDDREEVVSAIQYYSRYKTERGIVLFGAYSMGKSQELVRILNEKGMAPAVDEHVAKINRVYESFNVKLDYECFGEQMPQGNFVGIVSSSRLSEWKTRIEKATGRRVFTAVATGFAKMFRFDTDVQFALSDHADFKQAIEYISMCAPREIYTRGSGARLFAANLKSAGYAARPLSEMGQAMLLGPALASARVP